MSTPIRISSIQFSDGTSMPPGANSIVVLVGPNNSGKSRALREINQQLTTIPPQAPGLVVSAIAVDKLTDEDGLKGWLRENAHVYHNGVEDRVVRPHSGEVSFGVAGNWSGGPPFQNLGSFLVMLANTESRLGLAGSAGTVNLLTEHPSAPLHELYVDEALERQLSDAVQRAFGTPIAVNRVAGSQIHLHMGTVEVSGPATPTNRAYREALGLLPLVQGEGDGVRSYIGLLLAITATRFPVVLIDEPEAFLHPPQARQLGRELARLRDAETQLVVATHSADFVQGVLDDPSVDVSVVRLVRDGDVNRAAVLAASELRTLWADPILRYSSLLDGLFHRGAVLCESDSDCRFYQATLDSMLAREHQPAHDLLFTHTGGKDRLPTAIAALRAIDVEVQVIADFDVLAREALLKQIVESLNGDWSAVERDWRVVHGAVAQLTSTPSMVAVREGMEAALNGIMDATLTKDGAEKLRRVAKLEDGWTRAKRGGAAVLPQGDAPEAAERLLAALESLGLHVVSVGELERWAPAVGGHGPAWVAAALEAHIHEATGHHVDFVRQLLDRRTTPESPPPLVVALAGRSAP